MPPGALALVLASAAMHAGWNLLMKRSVDRLVAGWAIATTGGLASLPLVIALGPPDTSAWPALAVSAGVHVAYAISLAAAYDHADLSVAYPVARGVSPVLVGVGGVLFLGDDLPVAGWLGVVLTSAGLVYVGMQAGRLRGLGWAVLTGAWITTYTLLDASGARAGDDALRYVLTLFMVHAIAFLPVALVIRGPAALKQSLVVDGRNMVTGGVLSVGAYGLVLAATLVAPVGAVSAVRETSVVLGTLAGWLVLGEAFGARRTAGAFAVAGGVAALALV